MTLRHSSRIDRRNQWIITVVSWISWLDMSGIVKIDTIGVKARYRDVEKIGKNLVVVIEYLKKSRNIRAFSQVEIRKGG
jgi:hypothetical protein